MKRAVLATCDVCGLLWAAGANASVTITDVQWKPGASCTVDLYPNSNGTGTPVATSTYYGGEMTYKSWSDTSVETLTRPLSNPLWCVEIPEQFTPGNTLT